MALTDLIASFTAFASAIDDFIDKQSDPYASDCQRLRRTEQSMIDFANDIAAVAAQQISDQIAQAVTALQTNVDSAKQTLAELTDATGAINVAAAVLGVAAAVASGGVLSSGNVTALEALAKQVDQAVTAATS